MYLRSYLLSMVCLLVYSVVSASAADQNVVEYNWGGSPVYMFRTADNFIVLYDRSESMADRFLDTPMSELAAERKILVEKNATLPDMNWQAGIYSFTPGHGTDNLTTYYPMQPYDKSKVQPTSSPRCPVSPWELPCCSRGSTSWKRCYWPERQNGYLPVHRRPV